MMTPDEMESALRAAFRQCEQANAELTRQQKELIWQALGLQGNGENPLHQLTQAERQVLLRYIREQDEQQQDWKTTLLNDWLQGYNSGSVQFIRDRYGMQWLEQVQPTHLAEYINVNDDNTLMLKVGDRIEVCNGLWEWVQDNGPCGREWFPCRVIGLRAAEPDGEGVSCHASCVVRFESGMEYEIQGIYEWNRPNWRWME
jgi:hypothetical protein